MSLNSYLIVGARPYGEDEQDIRIINGCIAEIGVGLDPENLEVVQAKGRVCLPSFVDLHAHLREPGREDAETISSGSRAATLGGFSAVFAMANTAPVADTAGVVEQVGSDVHYVKPGDHVITCLSVFCGHCEQCLTHGCLGCWSDGIQRRWVLRI